MVQVKVKVNRLAFNEPTVDGKGKSITNDNGKIVMSDPVLYRKGDVFDIIDIKKAEKLKRGNSIEILGKVPVVEDADTKEIDKLRKQVAEQEVIIAEMKLQSKVGNAKEATVYGSVPTPPSVTHTPVKK